MADITTVGSQDEFVQSIVADEDLELTDDGAEELWRIWNFRHDNGATDDVLVALPPWFAQDEFGKSRPYFFGKIERDDPDSGAILFTDIRLVDVSIIENQVWDDVTASEALEVLDVTDDNDFIEEKGKDWVPRSLMRIYDLEGDGDEGSAGASITDIASPED